MARKLTEREKETFIRLYEGGARLLSVAAALDISETRAKRLRSQLGLAGRRKQRSDPNAPPRKIERGDHAVEPPIDYAAVEARWASQAGNARFEDVENPRQWRLSRIDRAPKTYSIVGNAGGMCVP
jgi:hypothetical protein